MKINIDRLIQDIERYGKYGENEQGGVTRPSFSKLDHEVRSIFIKELEELGLKVTVDAAGNIWGRKKGNGTSRDSIVLGSHLDTVPNGGKYDGALGVLMAKEILKTIIENNVSLEHDLEIVSFTAEESNDFNLSTFGSRSFVGKLKSDDLRDVTDSNGVKISDELKKVGGDLDKYPMMQEMAHDKKVFIELHIEQGKRLESNDISMAIINRIVGTHRSNIRVIGEPNHSGTTMMDHRKDALTAVSEMILELERQCQAPESNVVGTVGKLNVLPNAANIIPGQVDFILEIRGESEEEMEAAINSVWKKWHHIAEKRQVEIQQEIFLDQKPVILDENIVHSLRNTAIELAEPYMILPSMAVHDAAHMAKVSKSVMVFVKSINGKSHCPEEYSLPHDIEKAGNLILHGVLNIDKELALENVKSLV